MRRWLIVCCTLLLVVPMVGCARAWDLTVRQERGTAAAVTARQWQEMARAYPAEVQDGQALALERVLWQSGVTTVESVQVGETTYAWRDVCSDSWLLKSGALRLAGQTIEADEILVTPPAQSARLRLIDLTPTIAGALGVRSPAGARGKALGGYEAQQVVVVAIDGLSYLAYQDIRNQNVTPLLDGLGEPRLMLSTYPSTADAALAAILCGADADAPQTEAPSEALFDVLAEAGRTGVAILPRAPSVEMGPAKRVLVAPADASEDVTATAMNTALRVLRDEPPALLWLQLDSLARAAAVFGLGTDETTARLASIDDQLNRLVAAAPRSGLVLILGSTGLHPPPAGTTEGAVAGTLLASDMFVPLWVIEL